MQRHNFCKIIATLQLLLKINAKLFYFFSEQKLALLIIHIAQGFFKITVLIIVIALVEKGLLSPSLHTNNHCIF